MASTMNNSRISENTRFIKSNGERTSNGRSPPTTMDCSPLMAEIMQIAPFPNVFKVNRTSPCASEISIGKATIKSDSGYASPKEIGAKLSRWIRLNEALLHTDVKKFLKLNTLRGKKSSEAAGAGKFARSNFKESLDEFDDSEFDMAMLQQVLAPKLDIVRCLLELCDIIMFFMNQRRDTERRVFKVQPSPCVNIDVDLKSIVLRGDPSALEMKVPKVIQVLYRDMDVRGTEMMIRDIEVYCGKRGLPVDYSEAGTEDLKESIEAFRFRYDEFNNCATVDNMNNLICAARSLCATLKSISTRLWVLSNSIEVC